MPKVLLAWELGGGLGHLVPLRAIGMELVRRGYEVAIAANNVPLCQQGLAGTGVEVLAAPRLAPSDRRLKIPCTYGDLLHDCGYASAEQLTATGRKWLKLFDSFRPDLLVCDHSPTALVASRARDLASAVLGTGFLCPPDVAPFPSLHPQITEPHWADEVEQTVLANINAALAAFNAQPVERVTQVFAAGTRQYLLTIRQLDPYVRWRAADTRYWQPVGTLPGVRCTWPTGLGIAAEGPRVFVHLRADSPIMSLLEGLACKRIVTVCFAPAMPADDCNFFVDTSVVVSTAPVDLRLLLQDCDVAVLNGGHGAVYSFLKAGVPLLLLPTMLEQQLTADVVTSLGLGLQAPLGDLNALGGALEDLLHSPKYKTAAIEFSQTMPQASEAEAVANLVEDLTICTF